MVDEPTMQVEQAAPQQFVQAPLNQRLLNAIFDPNTPKAALQDILTEIQMLQIFASQKHEEVQQLTILLGNVTKECEEIKAKLQEPAIIEAAAREAALPDPVFEDALDALPPEYSDSQKSYKKKGFR